MFQYFSKLSNKISLKYLSGYKKLYIIIIIIFIVSTAVSKVCKNYISNSKLKYILLWSTKETSPFVYLGEKRDGFCQWNCSLTNCYITEDRNYFGGDLTKFHAIAFNGASNMNTSDLPEERSPHQKYIYFNMESADNFPVCDPTFDNFFNWTATYRLDSDIYFGYVRIKNASGHVVGPRIGMKWQKNFPKVKWAIERKLSCKSIAAAWFVSHCETRGQREKYGIQLYKVLKHTYQKKLDIYGDCTDLKCTKGNNSCLVKLKRKYYFYLSFENSLSEDYVTEKLLTAVNNNAVPIVFGGSNYNRFLPPHAYLNANKLNVTALASIMNRIISSHKLYVSMIKWRGHYDYTDSSVAAAVCDLCAALNDKKRYKKFTLYRDFRKWWVGSDWTARCDEIKTP